jgi:hypothetical protein
MSLTAKETGSSIAMIPQGVYTAVCSTIVDVGHHYSEKYEKNTHKIVVSWEIPEQRIDVDRDGKKVNLPRVISKRYTLSLGDKAILRKDLEAWRGKAFTAPELLGFDLKKLIGAACQLQVIHTSRDSKTYANVGALMALPKGVNSPKLENEPLFFSFEDAGDQPIIPANMPEWTAELIKESKEWEKLTAKQTKTVTAPPVKVEATAASTPSAEPGEVDDVPF